MNWRIKPLDAILASAEKKSLARTLGPFQLTMLGVGAVIGAGIFLGLAVGSHIDMIRIGCRYC